MALDNLPKTLQEIYNRILGTLEQSPRCREVLLMLRLLTWSETPLTFGAMIDALTVRPEESPAFEKGNRLFNLKHVILDCSSLVSVIGASETHQQDHKQQEIHLAHSSVKEYLRSRHLARPFDQLSEEVHARGLIAQTCIGYLMSLPIDHFWDPDQYQFPFAAIASHWMEHAKVAEATDDTLVQLILKLYQLESARLGTAKGNNKLYNHTEGNGKLEYKDWNDGLYDYMYKSFAKPLPYQKDLGVLYEGPLTHASYWGLGTVVHRLLEAGTDVNADQCSDNPLHAAAFHGHDSVVKMLLANGANVNGTNDGQFSIPLVATSFNGHVMTAQILLQHGASIYGRSMRGNDAFGMASMSPHPEFLRFLLHSRLLLEQSSDTITNANKELHLMNRRPGRCVHGAQDRRRRSAEMAAGLQDRDLAVDPSCTHFCLHEALFEALTSSYFACVETLIEYGADPRGCRHDCGNGRPQRPWLFAIKYAMGPDFGRIINLLWEKGAELDAQTTRSVLLGVLYFRVQGGGLSDVPLLLEILGDTVVGVEELNELRQRAIDWRHDEAAELFLELGADPHACEHQKDLDFLEGTLSIPRSDGHHESRRGSWSDLID